MQPFTNPKRFAYVKAPNWRGAPPAAALPPAAGKLTKKAVQPLIKDPTALSRLRELYITDQGIDYGAVQRLLKARRQLKVQAGETDSDSYAWSCVLRASGRTYGDGLYGRW